VANFSTAGYVNEKVFESPNGNQRQYILNCDSHFIDAVLSAAQRQQFDSIKCKSLEFRVQSGAAADSHNTLNTNSRQ
jgi:hypothetical protein